MLNSPLNLEKDQQQKMLLYMKIMMAKHKLEQQKYAIMH